MIRFIDVYNKALTILRKETSGRALRPKEYSNLIPEITNRHFEDIYRKSSTDTENNSKISRFFETFSDSRIISTESPDSKEVTFKLPSDYYHHRSGVQVSKSDNPSEYYGINILNDIEYIESMNSYILRPRQGKEKAIINGGALKILSDTNISSEDIYVKLPYIRKPEVQTFNYNATSSGLTQTDNNGFDFSNEDEMDIINIVLELLGVQLKRQDIYQYSQVRTMEDNS